MFATGVMDPNWWKYDRLNHRWYRDDDTYADYCEAALIMGFEKSKFIGVHFDGAEGYSAVLIPMTSYMSTDEPFELQISGTMELKSPDGTNKYRVIKIVCESKMLTFTVLKLSSNEEIAVTMVIAPDGFTTNIFDDLMARQVTNPPSSGVPKVDTAQPLSEWICPCGTRNNGNFCSQCGHPRGQ
ncbi:MAG: hypothetical protein IKW90_08360 [Lachnospiraceae bacterium]|nr:hypothetical protein [Lachnospiraceae bacterium]